MPDKKHILAIMNNKFAGPNSNELYDALPPDVCAKLAASAEMKTFPAGIRLLRSTLHPHCVMIVHSGAVEISLPVAKSAFSLIVAGKGRVLGLRSVMTGDPPEIDATTLEKTTVTLIPENEFTKVLNECPQMYVAIAKVLTTDLKTADSLRRRVTGGGPIRLCPSS